MGALNQLDFLIVGAGFSGSVIAERLAAIGQEVLVVDRRPHVGGNAYDHLDDDGVLLHRYGPHIFHTNSKEIFAYLSRFTRWRPYEHRVLASVDGQLVPLPINLDTLNRLYGTNMDSAGATAFLARVAEPRETVRTGEDLVISRVGRELYEKLYRGYTRKQWGVDPSELDASVLARVPVRTNRDDRYFTDLYQAMPRHGYTRLIENLLDHPRIHLLLRTEWRDVASLVPRRGVVCTAPVDAWFDHRFGPLPYRSLRFERAYEHVDRAQPAAVINYPNEHPWTRVTEMKWLTGQFHPGTTLLAEHPQADGDPYYPVPTPESASLYRRYAELAEAERDVWFVGRLGTYRYLNMDQCVAQALTTFGRIARSLGVPVDGLADAARVTGG